ncbi:MAG TPA: aminopeptidase [Gaiellaceae bacterium]|jgi:aminopeptidase|nr:aminopeptidase [Gaiellaceae bacterium]
MIDHRVTQYARLLVETCLDVQPEWQVIVGGSTLARPLVEEVSRLVGRRGAYALQRVSLDGAGLNVPWACEAPEELLSEPAPILRYEMEHADAYLTIDAPENTRQTSAVSPERLALLQAGTRPLLQRILDYELRWIGCQYPTPALAQDAGMSLAAFEDFLFGACLLDWDAERKRMRGYADRFEEAEEVRIVADGTDLTLGVAGRTFRVDAGGSTANMPGGEFFTSPLEDSASGTIAFTEFPAVHGGREVTGLRLHFEQGRVVDASATANEEFLIAQLDTDDGARRLGELGIGCNPGITRYMKNTLFDEKIDGTIHLALGQSLPEVGGTNESRIHWDLVKDLRPRPEPHHRAEPDGAGGQGQGGRIELDGEVVQQDGRWLI